MISFAQNFEDVMIARIFPEGHQGFYIDIGAADPVHLSVTKHFYDAGWQGINVEPLPKFFARIEAARPRDLNLNALIGNGGGVHKFFEIEELPENSTSDKQVMTQLQAQGRTVRDHEVQVISLTEVCERHALGRQIDFMKIDVEGGELAVLQSADWKRFRPILLVIEAVVVNGREETWSEWEHLVTDNQYIKVWFDGLNNFYLRQESLHLRDNFRLPPNVFDGFQLSRMEPVGSEWVDQSELLRRIDLDRKAKQDVIDRLNADLLSQGELLKAIELDRKAKQDVIDRLVVESANRSELLSRVDLDRQAKQEVIDRLGGQYSSQTELLRQVDLDRNAKQQVIDRLVIELAGVDDDRKAKQMVIDTLVTQLNDARALLAARAN